MDMLWFRKDHQMVRRYFFSFSFVHCDNENHSMFLKFIYNIQFALLSTILHLSQDSYEWLPLFTCGTGKWKKHTKIVNSQGSHIWLEIINNGFRVKWRWENETKNIHLHGLSTIDRGKCISMELFDLYRFRVLVATIVKNVYVCIECKRCLSTQMQHIQAVRRVKYWYRRNHSNQKKCSHTKGFAVVQCLSTLAEFFRGKVGGAVCLWHSR